MIRAFLVLFVCVALAACGSPEERVEAYLGKAQGLFDSQEYQDARLEVANALQIDPKNTRARVLAARIAIAEGELGAAFQALQVAVDVDPDSLESHVLLGEIYYLAKMTTKLQEHAAAAEQISPGDPEVLLLRSRALSVSGDLEGAMDKVDQALTRDPELENAIVFKASLLSSSGDNAAGIAFLDERIARNLPAKSERLRNFRIVLLEGAGRNAEVEAALRALANDFPEKDEYTEALVGRFIREGRPDDAEQALKELANKDDDGYERRMNLIGYIATERSAEAAVEMTQQFLREDPASAQLRLTLAHLYESEERLDEALVAYGEVAEIVPGSAEAFEALNRIVSIRVRQGDPAAARTLIAAILAERPDNVDALLARAVFNYTDGKFDAVISDARVVLRKNPQSGEALLFLARGHARLGDVLLSQDAYRQLLALDPMHTDARNELAASFLGQGDVDGAEALWRERLDAVESRVGLIRVLLARGDLAEAETQARALIEADDANARGYLELGLVMQSAGKDQEAIGAYRQALERETDSGAALQGLVAGLLKTGKTDEAIADLNQYIEAYPDRPGARLLLAGAYQANGDRGRAMDLYEKLTTVGEPTIAAMAYRDLAALFEPGTAGRIDVLVLGVAAFPDNVLLSVYLAQEYQQSGQADRVIATYEAALAANSDNDLLANNLAATLLNESTDPRSNARALEIAGRFRNSNQAPFLDTLGWAYYKNADYANAVRFLETAVSLGGQIPALRYHLGMAYVRSGNSVNGRQELERAVSMSKSDFQGIEEAKATLAKLQPGS